MNVVIVGANHAGIAAANTLLDNYPDARVTMIDRNTNLSYLGCGTALWVGRQIDSYEKLFYTNEEAFNLLRSHMKSQLKARSFRLGSSRIDPSHPLAARCLALGMEPFGSPTLSDQALMPFPSLKLGPGHSARSHSADEYICLSEIAGAIDTYARLLGGLRL